MFLVPCGLSPINGSVRLVFVTLDDGDGGGDTWCAADALDTYFDKPAGLGYTNQYGGYGG